MKKLKNNVTLVTVLAITLLSFTFGVFAQQLGAEVVKYKIIVNQEEKKLDNDIVTINDRTYVPLRAVSEMLGKQVDWDEDTQTIRISDHPTGIDYELTEEDKEAEKWYQFKKDGLWGMMDAEGNVKIAPLYNAYFEFSEGLAAVEDREGKVGYIDTKGTVVIPFNFYRPDPYTLDPKESKIVYRKDTFSEGLAMVRNEKGMCGYINRKGELVIPFNFYDAAAFQYGAAKVGTRKLTTIEWGHFSHDYAYNYIDKTGKVLFKEDAAIAYGYLPELFYGYKYDAEKEDFVNVFMDRQGNCWGGDFDDLSDFSPYPYDNNHNHSNDMPNVLGEGGKIKIWDRNDNYLQTVDGHIGLHAFTYLLVYTDEKETDTFIIDLDGRVIFPKGV